MSTYAAPIRDMRFVVKELVGIDDIAQLPGCEEVTPDLVDAVRRCGTRPTCRSACARC
jgi:3-(methylthio)propanoyl-CoA dehydrogenase